MTAYDTFDTPLGRFTVVVRDDGDVVAAAFGDIDAMSHLIGPVQPTLDLDVTAEARRQLEAYFRGERTCFDLKLAEPPTPFVRRYRDAMAGLGFGQTTTYGELARRLDSSARATGRANATNPLCIIVPCHRVIGSDGSLTGYAYGLDVKRRLLEHEGASLPLLAATPAS